MKSPFPMLTTDSGFLISAEWALWDTVVQTIHLYHATLDLSSYRLKSLPTLREHIGTKSILSIISESDRLLSSRICDNWEYRTEYFFSPYCHIWSDIAKESWSKIGSLESLWDIESSEDSGSLLESISVLSLDSGSLIL